MSTHAHPETRHAPPAETTVDVDTGTVDTDTGGTTDTRETTETDPAPMAPFDAPDTSATFADDATRLPNTADGENRHVG